MATESFFDTYVIEEEDVERFCEIMNKKVEMNLNGIEEHQYVKGKEILEFLGIE